ncbi:MAG: MBL fold metallo-hydrolase [Bacteroidota bacterium]|nr:MBL fold metallo-hydrolase [Bacteroidota bacterium]
MKTWESTAGDKIIQLLSGRSNAFLLLSGGKKVIIDTGPHRKWHKLVKHLAALNIHQLDYLVLTHAHFDHASNSNKLKQRYGVSVIIHKGEWSYLEKGMNPEVRGTVILYKQLLASVGKSLMKWLHYEPCKADLAVEDLFDMRNLGINACLMHTPGHTPGSISVIINDEIALVGDCLFGIFKSSVYPPVALDSKELIKSWGKLLETGCQIFLPSHGHEKTREQVLKEYDKMKI